MTRKFSRFIVLVLTLVWVPGCLTDVRGPEAELEQPEAETTVAEDAELQQLLDEADARVDEAPASTRVGESALDHDHDHADCDHDHSHDASDHPLESAGQH